MKKIFFLLFTLILFSTSCSSVNNSITVKVDDNLNIDLVKIEYGFYSGHEYSDKKLVYNGLEKTIFKKNDAKSFNTICGENDFLVTYADKYYVKVRHLISNDFYDGIPDGHEYNFEIVNTKNGLFLTLKIVGTNGETITKEFAEIKDAANNQQGRKITKKP